MRNIKEVVRELRTLIGDDKVNESLRLLAFALEEFNLPKHFITDYYLIKNEYSQIDREIYVLGNRTNEIQGKKNGKIRDILEFINRTVEWYESDGGVLGDSVRGRDIETPKAPREIIIHVEAVAKHYDEFDLEPITLDLETGKIIVFFGENGSGKSTLLNILAGVTKHDTGKLTYFGKDEVEDWYLLKKKIGYIPQQIAPKNLNLKDLLILSCVTHEIPAKDVAFYIQDVVTKLKLEDELGKSWEELSSGFKMRFELARTIVWRPKILIMDEPLANLDIITQRKFLHDIVAYSRSIKNPISIIITSQHIETVEEIADEIIFLSKGKVIFKDHPTRLSGVSVFKEAELELTSKERNEEAIGLLEEHFKEMIVRLDGNRILIKTSKNIMLEDVLIFLFNQEFGIRYFKDNTTSARKLFNI